MPHARHAFNVPPCPQPQRRPAVSAQQNGVLPDPQQSIFVLSSLAYHDYEGVALREDEKPRLVTRPWRQELLHVAQSRLDHGRRQYPGCVLCGYTFESACMIQVRGQAGGGKLVAVDPRILATAEATGRNRDGGGRRGARLARSCASSTGIDPSYRN